jgi:ABC-type spermidine/putrescine transport system permease subunit II
MTSAAQAEPAVSRQSTRGIRLGPLTLTLPAAVGLGIFFLAPLAAFFVYSFLTSAFFAVSKPFTLDNYREAVASGTSGTLALNSLYIGLAAAGATLLIAFPIAYWLRYAADRLRLPVLFLVTATLFASYLVRIFAWRTILGENGLINKGLELLGVIDQPLGFLLYNRFAVTVALVHIFLPYVVLVLFAGFGPLSSGLLEAAQDLGAGPVTRWRRVILPLIAAPAATAFIFVFILSASDYVTPQFLGGKSGGLLGVQIQAQIKAIGDWGTGAALSMLMLAAFLVCYGLMALGLRIARLNRIHFGEVAPGAKQRSPLSGAVVALALIFLFAPLVVVVLFSFHKTGALSFPFKGFSLRWYRDVFGSDAFVAALKNSAIVATCVAAVTLILGTAASYGLSKTKSRLRGPLALLFFLPITLPGLFIGISLLVFFVRISLPLSLTSVSIAHFVYVFPYFLLIALAALDRLDPSLEESAADLGASPWTVFWKVTMPQVWPLLAGATALAFALSFDEFIITFFVIGSQSTLPMYIWSSFRRTVDPSINVVSTLLLAVMLVLWIIAFAFVLRAERGRRRAISPLAIPAEA